MGANVVPISSRRCCCRPIGTARRQPERILMNQLIIMISINYKAESLGVIHSIRRVNRIVVEEFIVGLHIRL